MMRTRLEIDLQNRISEKLEVWAHDSITLFEMADLEEEAFSAMIYSLMHFLAYSLAECTSATPAEVGKMVALFVHKQQKEMRERER